jgi:hypothetical protein
LIAPISGRDTAAPGCARPDRRCGRATAAAFVMRSKDIDTTPSLAAGGKAMPVRYNRNRKSFVQRFLLWAIAVLLILVIAVSLYRFRSLSHLNVTPDAKHAIDQAKKRT